MWEEAAESTLTQASAHQGRQTGDGATYSSIGATAARIASMALGGPQVGYRVRAHRLCGVARAPVVQWRTEAEGWADGPQRQLTRQTLGQRCLRRNFSTNLRLSWTILRATRRRGAHERCHRVQWTSPSWLPAAFTRCAAAACHVPQDAQDDEEDVDHGHDDHVVEAWRVVAEVRS